MRLPGEALDLDLTKLTDDQLRLFREEVDTLGIERGLWASEGAGRLAVAETIDIETARARIVSTVWVGVSLFNGTVKDINKQRRGKNKIPVVSPGELLDKAGAWLTNTRVEAAMQLPGDSNHPRLIIPRLSRPITHEEVMGSWQTAANGKLWDWSGRMEFLKNWTADELSGYDPEADDASRLVIVPTAYDEERRGTVAKQKANLEVLQADFPQLGVARIFDGAVIARRYKNGLINHSNHNWQDTYVRAIDLEPTRVDARGYVPLANVSGGGVADVGASSVQDGYAARLQVR